MLNRAATTGYNMESNGGRGENPKVGRRGRTPAKVEFRASGQCVKPQGQPVQPGLNKNTLLSRRVYHNSEFLHQTIHNIHMKLKRRLSVV